MTEHDECISCDGVTPENECPDSERPCGHHCNCSWIHDHCHWCGVEFGEEGKETKMTHDDFTDEDEAAVDNVLADHPDLVERLANGDVNALVEMLKILGEKQKEYDD